MIRPTLPPPLGDQLCFAVYSANIAINRTYLPVLARLGLTYPQYLVLCALGERDGQSIGGIADRLALEASTVTPLVKRMEATGLVSRGRNPADERQVVVRLTDSGRALHARSGTLTATLLKQLSMTPVAASSIAIAARGLIDRLNSPRPSDSGALADRSDV